jgi:hypothetical protein
MEDKQDIYHIKQINNTVWILGATDLNNASGTITNIFSGVLDDNFSKISGKWIDFPLSSNMKSGNVDFQLLIDSPKKKYNIDSDFSGKGIR